MNSTGTEPYIHTYPFFPRLPPIPVSSESFTFHGFPSCCLTPSCLPLNDVQMVTVCSFQSKNSYPTFMYILISSLVIRVWTGYFTIDHKTVTFPLCYCYCIKNNPKLSGFKTATISFAHIDMNDSLDELRQAVFFWSFSWHWLGSFILLDSAGLGWRGQHAASSPEAGVSFHMPGLGFPRLPGLWGDLQVSWFWRWRVPADKEATGLWRASPRAT